MPNPSKNQVLIVTHIHADLDGFSSMIGARHLFPGAILSMPGSQERCVREIVQELDTVRYGLVSPKQIVQKEIRHLILVDTKRPERLGCFESLARRQDLLIEVFDHHPWSPGDVRADRYHFRPCGSNAAMISTILREKNIQITSEEATLLAMGIYEDTGSLTFHSTTPEDLEAVAWLLTAGANLPRVGRRVARILNADQIRLLGELLNSLERHALCGVTIGIATAYTDHYVEDLAVLAHRLGDMEPLNVLFVAVDMGSGSVYLVARSSAPEIVDAGRMATHFGGGGHATAAFASIRDQMLPQVIDALKVRLFQETTHPTTAQEIMSWPLQSIEMETTVDAARALLTRYTLRSVPVLKNGLVTGIINRNILEKAAFHKLSESPAHLFMMTEFKTVNLHEKLSKIKQIIMEAHQPLVPVLSGEKPVGCITRTDLFRALEKQRIPVTQNHPVNAKSSSHTTRRPMDCRALLARQLPSSLLNRLRLIGKIAHTMGMQTYLVGGIVRDLLLDRPNLDSDVVVEGGDGIYLAEAVAKAMPGARVNSYRAFLTATLVFPKEDDEREHAPSLKVDIATARMEYYRQPAALPIVEKGSLKADLERRDFTINSMAIHLDPEQFGFLTDIFGGRRDLRDKAIRVLHNLSFIEDPTRVFRAVRFEQILDFRIGAHTQRLLDAAVRMDFLLKLSGKRLFTELKYLLCSSHPVQSIRRLAELDLLRFIHPDITWNSKTRALLDRVEEVLTWHRLSGLGERSKAGEKFAEPRAVDRAVEPWYVYLMALLYVLPQKETEQLLQAFNLPMRHAGSLLQDLAATRNNLFQFRYKPACEHTLWEIFQNFSQLSSGGLLLMMAVAQNQEVQRTVVSYWRELRPRRPEVYGHDLIAMGLQPGPHFKTILNAVHQQIVEKNLLRRKEQLDYLMHHRSHWFRLERDVITSRTEAGSNPEAH